MVKYKVAIVIPAFNEEATISNVVQSVKEYGIVVVVNDASSDKTKKMAESAGAIVINHKDNKGYDDALNSGFKKAEELDCNAVITFDADGQHNPIYLTEYINYLKEGVDLVLGVRPKVQRFSEYIFKLYTRKKYKWKDPLCGLKGYSIQLYRDKQQFDSYHSIGTELACFGMENNYSYKEVEININKRADKPRFSSVFGSNIKILRSLFLMIMLKERR
jgi:glycosyltransferase involved in cell wall biosynthesis